MYKVLYFSYEIFSDFVLFLIILMFCIFGFYLNFTKTNCKITVFVSFCILIILKHVYSFFPALVVTLQFMEQFMHLLILVHVNFSIY